MILNQISNFKETSVLKASQQLWMELNTIWRLMRIIVRLLSSKPILSGMNHINIIALAAVPA